MGLDVVLYEDVQQHECDTRRPRDTATSYWKKKMSKNPSDHMYMFTPEDNVDEAFRSQFSPAKEFYECNCKLDKIVTLLPGYVSCLDVDRYPYFGPYEFRETDGFYFGSYTIFALATSSVPMFRSFMSDCDGCYGGERFLELLKTQLEGVKHKMPQLENYFQLLDGKDLSNCVLRHC